MSRSVTALPFVVCLGLLTSGCSTLGQPKPQAQVAAPIQTGAPIDTDIQQILTAGGIDMAPAPAPDSLQVVAGLQSPSPAPSGFLPPMPPEVPAVTEVATSSTALPQAPTVVTSVDDVPVGVLPDNVSVAGYDMNIPADMTLPTYSFEGQAAPVRASGILPPAPPVTQTIVLTGPDADPALQPKPVAVVRSGPPVPVAMPTIIKEARSGSTASGPAWQAPVAIAPRVNSDKPLAPVIRF